MPDAGCWMLDVDLDFGEIGGAVVVLVGAVDVEMFHPENVGVQVGDDPAFQGHRGAHQRRLVAEIFRDDRLHVQTLCSFAYSR